MFNNEYPYGLDVYGDHSRRPYYNDESDYVTNAPSYYDDLARKQRLIKYLAEKIGEYDKELEKRFKEWDDLIQRFPENVEHLLIKWMEDGTLDKIINENIFKELNKDIKSQDEKFTRLLELINIEILKLKDSYFYSEITTEEKRGGTGKYLLTHIPYKDLKGEVIRPEKQYSDTFKTARDFAKISHSSLTLNASIFDVNTMQPVGLHIKDGNIIEDRKRTTYTLGYNAETHEFNVYPPDVSTDEIIRQGNTDTWQGFFPIIDQYTKSDDTPYNKPSNMEQKHPRQVIAQSKNKDIYVFTFRGREDDDPGYTYPEMYEVLKPYNFRIAYVLDGGGSNQLVKDNLLMSVPLDEGYRSERKVYDVISFIKKTDRKMPSEMVTLGELSAILQKIEVRHISKYGDKFPGQMRFLNHIHLLNDKALHSIDENGDSKRLLGFYDDIRYYLGNLEKELKLQAKDDILVDIGSKPENYRIVLESVKPWVRATLSEGWAHNLDRDVRYKEINPYEFRITGVALCGRRNVSDKPIFILPPNLRPSRIVVFPVSVLSGGRENNDVIIYTNGEVKLRFPVTTPSDDTGVSLEFTVYKGV